MLASILRPIRTPTVDLVATAGDLVAAPTPEDGAADAWRPRTLEDEPAWGASMSSAATAASRAGRRTREASRFMPMACNSIEPRDDD